MNVEHVFSAILDFNKKMAGTQDFQAQVPCLIGPTGCGKTTRTEQEARKREMPSYRLLLQTKLPEEVTGLPRVIDNITRWSLAEYAAALVHKPGFLFLDELDKARPESLGAVLTLMAEKRVHDTCLHPQTHIVAAMQPVTSAEWLSDQTGQALSARMCFLPVLQNWNFLGDKYGLDFSALKKDTSIELPVLPRPSMRQVDWFVNFCRHNPREQELWECVAAGMFSKEDGAFLIETIRESVTHVVAREDLVALLKENPEGTVDKLTIPELCLLVPDIFQHGTKEAYKKALVRAVGVGSQDDAALFLENQYNGLLERVKANGGKLQCLGDTTDEELYKLIDDAARTIGEDYWLKQVEPEASKKAVAKKKK